MRRSEECKSAPRERERERARQEVEERHSRGEEGEETDGEGDISGGREEEEDEQGRGAGAGGRASMTSHRERERGRECTESCDRAARVGWQCQRSLLLFPPWLSFLPLRYKGRSQPIRTQCLCITHAHSLSLALSLSLCLNVKKIRMNFMECGFTSRNYPVPLTCSECVSPLEIQQVSLLLKPGRSVFMSAP